ncbi:MAG: hypothetical protein JXR27_06865 [Paludibacteraceae bacterium]|nr:hypothetical protein [Paludibacteraceae bacterium]
MKNFYKITSLIFQPLLMPFFGMLMLMNMQVFAVLPTTWKLISISGTLVFTGIMPAVPILLMLRKGEVKDLFISKKEDRTFPYLFSFVSYLFWVFFLWRTLRMPYFIVGMGAATTISILLITTINLKWKISAHLSGIGGLLGGVFGVCYRLAYNPLWLLIALLAISALVALSRIELKAHTPGQTLAGFSLAFVLVFLPAVLL